jgi:hypothetical protein
LVAFELQLELLPLEHQQPIISRPLFRIAEQAMGGDNLPEPLWSIRIAGMEVGVVRLDGRAERLLQGVNIIILMSTEKTVKRFHQHTLDRRAVNQEVLQNACMFSTRQIRVAKSVSIKPV